MLDRDQDTFSRDVIRPLTEQPIDYIDMSFPLHSKLFSLIISNASNVTINKKHSSLRTHRQAKLIIG